MTTEMISSKLELHRLNTGRIVPVCTANMLIKQMLFRYQGHVGAALILGGYDLDGPQLYCIYPHGSTEKLKYTTMGSGSLAAMAVFESRWKPDMSVRNTFDSTVDQFQSRVSFEIWRKLSFLNKNFHSLKSNARFIFKYNVVCLFQLYMCFYNWLIDWLINRYSYTSLYKNQYFSKILFLSH